MNAAGRIFLGVVLTVFLGVVTFGALVTDIPSRFRRKQARLNAEEEK